MDGKRALAGVGLVLALISTSACGKASETISEKAAEKAAEQAGGGNVDIDTKDGKVKVSSKDGEATFEADENGNVKITGEDGESTMTAGEDAELPEGWPSEIELPKGATLTLSSTTAGPDGDSHMITAETDDAVKDVYEDMKSMLDDAGYDIAGDSMTSSDSGDFASLSAESEKYTVAITIVDGGGDGATSISINVAPASA